MSFSVRTLVSHGVSQYHISNNAELAVYAALTTACLSLTAWQSVPQKTTAVKKALRFEALRSGIPATDYDDKAGAIFKVAGKLVQHMALSPEVIAVRDAVDEPAAINAMLGLFAIKGMTCRAYFKRWATQDGVAPYDAEAVKRAKEAKEAAAHEALLNMRSDIDASSEAIRNREEADATAKATAEAALSPVERFALHIATVSDAALIDAMHAVLNARQAELRAVADSVTMPKAVEKPVSRGQRAAARKVKALADLPALVGAA